MTSGLGHYKKAIKVNEHFMIKEQRRRIDRGPDRKEEDLFLGC